MIQVNRSGDGIGLRAAQGIDQMTAIPFLGWRGVIGVMSSTCSPFELDSRHLS